MKQFFIITLIFFLSACSSNKPTTTSENPKQEAASDIYRINDMWLLETINSKTINKAEDGNKTPQLEIHVEKKQVLGNDGCNQISGGLKMLDKKNITFGMLMGTKMMCPEMETTSQFLKAISKTTNYKIEHLKLYFYDSNGKELLQFKKID